jgi:hypothetical protein
VTFVRDATQDCAAANASATTLTATFPGGAQAAGRLLVGVAQLPTAAANVSTKGGSGFTTGFSQDDFSAASLIGVAKIATGSETGITFTHGDTAGQIRILAFVYDGALSPLAIEQPAGTADDGSQHANVTVTLAGATVGTSDLIISAASLLGTGTTPLSSNGTIIGNSGGGLFVAQRIVSTTGTFSDVISWTSSVFRTGGIMAIKAAPTYPGWNGWEVTG